MATTCWGFRRGAAAVALGFAGLLAAGCASHSTKPQTGADPLASAQLASRRPGQVSRNAVEPLQRLAYQYNTTSWSYTSAIDIDRDLAQADPSLAGADATISARISLAYNLAPLGRLTEAAAALDEAERQIAAQQAALSPLDRRLLRVNLLIARSVVAGHEAERRSGQARTDAYVAAAVLAGQAAQALDAREDDGAAAAAGPAAMREGSAIVLDPVRTALYNAGTRSNGAGDVVARPMTDDEKLLVLRVRAQYAQAAELLAAGRMQEAKTANHAAAAATVGLPSGVAGWLRAEIDYQGAMLALDSGDIAEAEAGVQRALSTVRKEQGQSRLEAFLWRALARVETSKGDLARAKAAEAASFKILVDQNDGMPPTRAEVASYLKLLAPSAVAEDPADVARMFEVASVAVETETARAVADVAGRFATSDSASGAAIRRLQYARQRVDQAQARLARIQDAAAKPAPEMVRSAEAEEVAARQEVAEATAAALAVGGARASAVLSPRTEVAEVQAALRPDEAYLRYIFLDEGPGYGVLVRKDRVRVVRLGLTEAEAATAVADLRSFADQVASTNRLRGYRLAKAWTLYQALFPGLEPDLADIHALVVEPAGPLFALPFGALLTRAPEPALEDRFVRSRGTDYTGAPWLARAKTLELSVGASAFVRLRKTRPSPAPRSILAFADPTPQPGGHATDEAMRIGAERVTRGLTLVSGGDSSAAGGACAPEAQAILDFPPLPDTLDEARAAVGALGGRSGEVVSGAAFTDAAVVGRKDLNQYRALLFATHAALPNQAKCWPDPFLITTKGPGGASDGVLETTEIANLELDADLVVLSACNTGAGDTSGQALGGLAQSFVFAGSRGVVVSHWIANSRGATSLTSRMYAELATGETPAAALAKAERVMMDERAYSHPYYWALFMVVGGAAVAPGAQASGL